MEVRRKKVDKGFFHLLCFRVPSFEVRKAEAEVRKVEVSLSNWTSLFLFSFMTFLFIIRMRKNMKNI